MGDDEWRILCITYNLNARRSESDQLYQLLDQEDAALCDIAVIAFQEVSHWELFGTVPTEETWQSNVCAWMSVHGKSLLSKQFLASNLLMVFARLDVFKLVDSVQHHVSRSTLLGLTGHKGTLVTRIKIKGGGWLAIASSHLLPHATGYEARCEQYFYGRSCISDDDSWDDVSAIWLGDMNWRVDSLSSQQMLDRLDSVQGEDDMDALVDQVDQLRRAQREDRAFTDFHEAPIHFAPTYRIVVGEGRWDALRVPSWCDRVLYRGSALACERYSANRMITMSDHFPVIALLRLQLQPTECQWNVQFERVPRWFSLIPFICRFSYRDSFWDRSGSYRDWIGVFPATMPDPSRPLNWLYAGVCYEALVQGQTLSVAEFPNLDPGDYRLAYFSVNRNCIQGLSAPFRIEVLE